MKLNTIRLAAAVAAAIAMFGGAASAATDKLATYEQMRGIAAELQTLRGNSAEQARYADLQAQFDALKASMGGDDPPALRWLQRRCVRHRRRRPA